MSDTATAWLLRVAENIQISIGVHEAAGYIEKPEFNHVPLAPAYCNKVILWHEMIIPVVDLNYLYGQPANADSRNVVIIAYQQQHNTPLKYIALKTILSPEKIMVDDTDACDIPDSFPESLRPYVLSMFTSNQQATCVMDMAQLSSGNF